MHPWLNLGLHPVAAAHANPAANLNSHLGSHLASLVADLGAARGRLGIADFGQHCLVPALQGQRTWACRGSSIRC